MKNDRDSLILGRGGEGGDSRCQGVRWRCGGIWAVEASVRPPEGTGFVHAAPWAEAACSAGRGGLQWQRGGPARTWSSVATSDA